MRVSNIHRAKKKGTIFHLAEARTVTSDRDSYPVHAIAQPPPFSTPTNAVTIELVSLQDEESARTRGGLDLDGQKQRCKVKGTHTS